MPTNELEVVLSSIDKQAEVATKQVWKDGIAYMFVPVNDAVALAADYRAKEAEIERLTQELADSRTNHIDANTRNMTAWDEVERLKAERDVAVRAGEDLVNAVLNSNFNIATVPFDKELQALKAALAEIGGKDSGRPVVCANCERPKGEHGSKLPYRCPTQSWSNYYEFKRTEIAGGKDGSNVTGSD